MSVTYFFLSVFPALVGWVAGRVVFIPDRNCVIVVAVPFRAEIFLQCNYYGEKNSIIYLNSDKSTPLNIGIILVVCTVVTL